MLQKKEAFSNWPTAILNFDIKQKPQTVKVRKKFLIPELEGINILHSILW